MPIVASITSMSQEIDTAEGMDDIPLLLLHDTLTRASSADGLVSLMPSIDSITSHSHSTLPHSLPLFFLTANSLDSFTLTQSTSQSITFNDQTSRTTYNGHHNRKHGGNNCILFHSMVQSVLLFVRWVVAFAA